jgi:hypothetical protein
VTYPRFLVICDEETIGRAVQRESRNCFIAEAIKAGAAAIDLAVVNVEVTVQTMRYTVAATRLRFYIATPARIAWAIIHFDQGFAPTPFRFWIGKPFKIIRGRPAEDLDITVEQRNVRIKQRTKAYRARTKQSQAPEYGLYAQEEFQAPLELRQAVVAAMADPHVPLGPTIVLDAAKADARASRPIAVGGGPPRMIPNLRSTRRFGLREFIE